MVCQSQALVAQNTKPVALLPQVRSFQTSPASRDIDSAAKFIGAGAATVGVAGSGEWFFQRACNISFITAATYEYDKNDVAQTQPRVISVRKGRRFSERRR